MAHTEGEWRVIRTVFLLTTLMGILTPAPSAIAEELGRLFFDAQQRATLDDKRGAQKVTGAASKLLTRNPELDAVLPDTETQSMHLPEPRITGKVTRSSGNNTVWINHYPQYKKSIE